MEQRQCREIVLGTTMGVEKGLEPYEKNSSGNQLVGGLDWREKKSSGDQACYHVELGG